MCRPRLFGRLGSAARVTVVSAPPGSGKTVLLRSWIGAAGLAERAATAPEIASELYVSHNTVKAHMRKLYAKLGTHRRGETVARARALGLLAPFPLESHATLAR